MRICVLCKRRAQRGIDITFDPHGPRHHQQKAPLCQPCIEEWRQAFNTALNLGLLPEAEEWSTDQKCEWLLTTMAGACEESLRS